MGADFSCCCAAASQYMKLQKDGASVWCQLINIRVFMIHAAACTCRIFKGGPAWVVRWKRKKTRNQHAEKVEHELRGKVTLPVHRKPRDVSTTLAAVPERS